MSLKNENGRLQLLDIKPSSPAARIPRWRSRIRGGWLISVNGQKVSTIEDVEKLIADAPRHHFPLLFAHSEVQHGHTNDGVPLINSDQLNTRHSLLHRADIPAGYTFNSFLNDPVVSHRVSWVAIDSGGSLNMITRANRLTRGKLLKQDDWTDWENSEYLQLDQYKKQYMFGDPVSVSSNSSFFNIVWSYGVKVEDGRKKTRCTCDGSTRSGQVRVLDQTYANCVDHTSARLFYSITAVENLVIHGSDVSNAFGESPPPRQSFYIHLDRPFRDWWTKDIGNPPIPDSMVIPYPVECRNRN